MCKRDLLKIVNLNIKKNLPGNFYHLPETKMPSYLKYSSNHIEQVNVYFWRVLAKWNHCVMAVSGLLKIRQIATILGNNSANSLQKPRPDECCKFWGLEIRQQSCFSNHSPVKTKKTEAYQVKFQNINQ